MKVIIAVDQSEHSSQIIDAVLRRQWPEDTAFKLMTVLEPSQWEHLHSKKWQEMTREVFTKREAAASKTLMAARKRLESLAHCTIHVEVRHGSARGEIIAAATDWMADKIVVGAHGHSPNRLLGRVSQSIAQHAPCSVELVRLKRPSPATHSERNIEEVVHH